MRISKDDAFIAVARVLSLRGTCARRQVGAVFVNSRGHVIATGYNGNAAGDPHCIDTPCAGAGLPSGSGLDKCEAIHAEQNALEQCHDVWDIDTVYCTDSPCMHCLKMLKNSSARRIVFLRAYPGFQDNWAYWVRENNDRVIKGLPIREMVQYQSDLSWLKSVVVVA